MALRGSCTFRVAAPRWISTFAPGSCTTRPDGPRPIQRAAPAGKAYVLARSPERLSTSTAPVARRAATLHLYGPAPEVMARTSAGAVHLKTAAPLSPSHVAFLPTANGTACGVPAPTTSAAASLVSRSTNASLFGVLLVGVAVQ